MTLCFTPTYVYVIQGTYSECKTAHFGTQYLLLLNITRKLRSTKF